MSTPTQNYNLRKFASSDDIIQNISVDQPFNMETLDSTIKSISDARDSTQQSLTNHINSSTAHNASSINNDSSSVSGTKVSNALDSLSSRIDGLSPGTGDVNTALGVYKRTDNSNTNTYVATITGVTVVDGLRLNLEVTNSNTGDSTLNVNATGAKGIGWFVSGEFNEADPGMIAGVTELQYLSSIDKWVILTKQGVIDSDPITMAKSIEKTGVGDGIDVSGALSGKKPLVTSDYKGASLVNLVDNGVNYGNYSPATGFSFSSNGIEITGDDAFGQSNHNSLSFKNNTQYTLFIALSGNITTYTNKIGFRGFRDGFDATLPTLVEGINKVLITTEGNLTIGFRVIKESAFATGENVEMKILAILEGDQTSLDITEELAFGINHSKVTVASIGTNQFDENNLEQGGFDSNGNESPTTLRVRDKNPIQIIDGQLYHFKDSISINGSLFKLSLVNYLDSSGNFISQEAKESADTTFTPPVGTAQIRNSYGLVNNANISISDVIGNNDARIGLGQDDGYAPYSKAELELPELKSVPSVADTVNMLTGEGQKNVSEEFTFDGTEAWTQFTSPTGLNSDLAMARIPGWFNNEVGAEFQKPILGYNGIDVFTGETFTTSIKPFMFSEADGDLWVGFRILDLPTNDLAGFQSYLGTNNLKAQFKLSTPIPFQIESQQFFSEPGGVLTQDGAVKGEWEYVVAINNPSAINSLSKSVVDNNTFITNVSEQARIAKLDTSTTANTLTATATYLPELHEYFMLVVKTTITGASTLSINNETAKAIEKINSSGVDTALASGDLVANRPIMVYNRGDKYIVGI